MSLVAWSSPIITPILKTYPIVTFPHASNFSLIWDIQIPPLRGGAIRLAPSKAFYNSNNVVSQLQNGDEEEDEESVIGDCVVFEEGVFDGSLLETGVSRVGSGEKSVSPENLIPDEWSDVQKEINITKKERRRLARELEYGKRVEKRRQALMPISINSDEYESFKNEKLRQLNPVVLDNPEPKYFKENVDQAKSDHNQGTTGRVTPRNPRLAVYGKGFDDISALFQSGRYVAGSPDNARGGSPKLFSKEEKILANKRVPDLAVATSGKWHPLHSLAACGEFYLATSLLKHNVDINSTDQDGLTALHKSILGKKQAIFNFLLRESANPFLRDNDGATLMHYAVWVASTPMIKILLLYNVDINLQDNYGWTPLHLAVQSLRTDIVRLLLIKGADKTLKNKDGLTPLDLCLYSGMNTRTYELIKLLKRLP